MFRGHVDLKPRPNRSKLQLSRLVCESSLSSPIKARDIPSPGCFRTQQVGPVRPNCIGGPIRPAMLWNDALNSFKLFVKQTLQASIEKRLRLAYVLSDYCKFEQPAI